MMADTGDPSVFDEEFVRLAPGLESAARPFDQSYQLVGECLRAATNIMASACEEGGLRPRIAHKLHSVGIVVVKTRLAASANFTASSVPNSSFITSPKLARPSRTTGHSLRRASGA